MKRLLYLASYFFPLTTAWHRLTCLVATVATALGEEPPSSWKLSRAVESEPVGEVVPFPRPVKFNCGDSYFWELGVFVADRRAEEAGKRLFSRLREEQRRALLALVEEISAKPLCHLYRACRGVF
ncbi:MAG: hypothetical protein ACPL3C_04595 [Pyrobaculum sp.]